MIYNTEQIQETDRKTQNVRPQWSGIPFGQAELAYCVLSRVFDYPRFADDAHLDLAWILHLFFDLVGYISSQFAGIAIRDGLCGCRCWRGGVALVVGGDVEVG